MSVIGTPRQPSQHARRATELQPDIGNNWYTLAVVQYRNKDWRDSLDSLEKVKAKEGGFDGSCWLFVAMNRQQLKQKEEARAALCSAVDWTKEQERRRKATHFCVSIRDGAARHRKITTGSRGPDRGKRPS